MVSVSTIVEEIIVNLLILPSLPILPTPKKTLLLVIDQPLFLVNLRASNLLL